MAKKDPAFLFYDGDAARDVSHMNRLERGCYFDLIQAQKKFGGYTMEQIKKIMGKDFDECWPALELVLKEKDGTYFIEWVRDSIEDRKVFAEKNRKRIQEYWDKKKENDSKEIPRNNHGTSNEVPYVNENEIEDVIINEDKGGVGEKENFILVGSEKIFESKFREWFHSSFQLQIPNWERLYPKVPFDDALKKFMLRRAFEKFNDHSHFRNSFALLLKEIEIENKNGKTGKSLATTVPVNEGKGMGKF